MVTIDKKESDFISSIKFICILTIVMVHCDLVASDYIAPRLVQKDIPSIASWYAALHFGEVALRLFFIISGYLFFRSVSLDSFSWKNDYFLKLKSRIKGLLILYLVWNTVGLITNYLIYKTYPAGVLEFLDGYNPFSQKGYFGRGLWFLESLMFFTLVSPLYYFAIKHLKHIIPVICLLFSLTSINIEYLYFNVYILLGAYLSCMGIKLVTISKLFNWRICLLIILLMQVFVRSGWIPIQISNFFSVFLFLAAFRGILYNNPLPSKISGSSTFVYVSHFYLTMVFKRIFLFILPSNMFGYVSNMMLDFAITTCICVCVYVFIINRFNILNILFAGGRTVKIHS